MRHPDGFLQVVEPGNLCSKLLHNLPLRPRGGDVGDRLPTQWESVSPYAAPFFHSAPTTASGFSAAT